MNKLIKSQSLKKNFIFQLLYQIIIFVIPFILSPYLTRKLGDTSLGVYTFTNSIVSYFMAFAMLGIARYGQRVIAQRKYNQEFLRKTFWSLYTIHCVFSFLIIIIYVIIFLFFVSEYKKIYLIQIFYLSSTLFDITWLFQGLENFKIVVIRNVIIKILECFFIFIFVNQPCDLYKYTLIMSISICLSQLVMIPQAIHYIRPIKFNGKDMIEHIKPLFILFLTVISASLYSMFDKTLLGLLSTKENVAYYEYSNKIIYIPLHILSVISTIMLPRACLCIAKNDIENSNKYKKYSLHFTCFIAIGAIFGLLSCGQLFALLYYGEDFAICGPIIISMLPLIYIIGIGHIPRLQYIIPKEMDKWLVISYFINASINLILSFILIPIIGIYGAIIGTTAAEIVGLVFQLILCRNFIKISDIIKTTLPYLFFGVIMYLILLLIQHFISNGWLSLTLQVVIGGVVYSLLSGIYLLYFSSIKREIKKILPVLKK